jgi:hypothetical protein
MQGQDMQIIYAIPFVIVSLAAFFLFLSIPRLRPYALPALAAPVAFGACSVLGLGLFMLAVDTSYDSLPRIVAIGAPLLAYLGSGFAAAWLAIRVAQFVKHRFHWK